ncbi:MAG: GNAT family N-acetyltransferase [Planctomycetota bacterium]
MSGSAAAEEVELLVGVPAERTWQVRHRNLRQGQPFETVDYGEVDRLPTTVHLVLTVAGEEVGCATLMEEDRVGGFGLRIRGMAVDDHYRGRGFGRILMEATQEVARERETGLWCNARVIAIPMYLACGFRQVGEEFEMPKIGPHYVLEWKAEAELP